jgi:hypothetical protein
LSQSEVLFLNNNINIDSYWYLGNLYDTSALLDKISIKILNIQSHLLLFDTKGSVFMENEKYAINKYCNVNLKFVNSVYPQQYK